MNSRHSVAWGHDPLDAGITVPMLSDSCDRAGFRNQVFESRLQPLVSPSRASGRARTVYYGPDPSTDPDKPYDDVIEFIDGTAPGEIVVAATDSSNACAFWGELFSAAAKGRGANGFITDGNIRDSDKIMALKFPVFSRSARPSDVRGRMRVEASHVSVRIGGVTIHPGDLIIADDDGIVVIPAEYEVTIVSYARDRARAESTVLQELLSGATLRKVWTKHGIL